MATCASCSARIIWAKSAATGKAVPLDAVPSEAGTVVVRKGGAFVLNKFDLAARLELPVLEREQLFVSHFATCPQASKWRAPRPESPRG